MRHPSAPQVDSRRHRACSQYLPGERTNDEPLPCDAANAFQTHPAPAPASWPERPLVGVQMANGFSHCRDRLVVLPPESRSLYRLAERLWNLIPVVAAKDSWRLHELSAVASQASAAYRVLPEHRSSCDAPVVSGRPTSVVVHGLPQRRAIRLSCFAGGLADCSGY